MNYRVQHEIHRPNPRNIDEDATVVRKNCAAVFDGVTLLHQTPYPNPSPAAKAAQKGAEAAVQYAIEHTGAQDFLRGSFITANHAIKTINEENGVITETLDFLKVQYAAAVGAMALLHNSTLHYAQINDCGVMVCKPNGKLIDNLIADKTNVHLYLTSLRQSGKLVADSAEEHQYVRSQVVNNPKLSFEGKLLDDYVLTGEEVAVNGVRVKKLQIQEPTKVIIYSDGFIGLLDDAGFRKKLVSIGDKDEVKKYVETVRKDSYSLREASLVVIDIQ